MNKKIAYPIKEKMVQLSGSCFWFWNSFYSFLDSCGVQKSLYCLYPKESYSKYDVMRNILTSLEEKGDLEIINNIISNFFRLSSAIDKDNVDVEKAKQRLKEFKDLVGNDPIEREIESREIQKRRQVAQEKSRKIADRNYKLNELKGAFIKLYSNQTITPQQRGFDLEKIFYDLLELEEFECSGLYRSGNEQIDGLFKYEKFDYLVEIKWLGGTSKQKDLSVFEAKIRGKAQSTRGLFFSVNGFDESAIAKFSGDNPKIILFDGQDFMQIMEGYISFFDYLRAKVDALVKHGKIFYKK